MITLTYFEILMLVFVSVLATAWFGWWHWREAGDDFSPLVGNRLPDDATRQDRINAMRRFYLECCVEDAQDGTQFDCYVFDFFDEAERKYGEI